MAGTFKNYPIMEIAILCVHQEDHAGGERAKIGDIITMRPPHHVIGSEEARRFLWLRLDGLEDAEFAKLKELVQDPPPTEFKRHMVQHQNDLRESLVLTRYDKRRCCVPLHRLQQVCPWIDLNRVRDPDDYYQPFVVPDTESHFYLAPRPSPLRVEGLVFDKVRGKYL